MSTAQDATRPSDPGEYEGYLSKATKEAGFAFFGRIFALLFGFVASAVIARLLGPDILGVYVLAWTVVMAAGVVTTLGFEGCFVKYISMYVSQAGESKARSVYSRGMRLGLLASIAAVVVIVLLRRPLAHDFFKEPRLEQALILMSVAVVPYTLTRLQAAGLRALKDMKRSISGAELWFRLPRLLLFLLLYYVGLRLAGVVGATVAACVVSAIATFVYLRRIGPFLFDRGPLADIPVREVMRYAATMVAETATGFALLGGSRLILGFFMESADVGIYNVVVLLAVLATLFTYSFNAIFSPIIADVYHRGRVDLMRSLLTAITRWIILLTVPVFAWLVMSGRGVLGIFGEEFARGYVPLIVLASAQVLDGAAGSLASCLAMTRYQRYNVYNTLAMAILSVGLNVWLIPLMGMVGAALGTGIAIVIVNIARFVEAKVLLDVIPFDRSTVKAALTSTVLVLAAVITSRLVTIPTAWYWSAATLLATYAAAFGLTFLMGTSDEDRMILGALTKKLSRSRASN